MKLDNNKKELVENLFAEYGKTELTRSEINEYIGKNSLPNPSWLKGLKVLFEKTMIGRQLQLDAAKAACKPVLLDRPAMSKPLTLAKAPRKRAVAKPTHRRTKAAGQDVIVPRTCFIRSG